ncbi:hypothetical protein RO3G_14427 [Rhizopus delemar RA 99-880]|uniref:Casein kinase II subunit beta n=1 Tax=Rhizopus delemar (strain RA 99-880 / ATCC MYA-4621 / FGSC 9543 / NRRL 43880) TaxID=246409 RepID=I1CMN6_RHIO9|nr:hypothetical protein RO3G_14427 [Rhizopus delemar RA 99-880]|eukprot:EIE89716.1 hypothetical protein RO3G_14427 [Rhizopus delemar RA 99-880]
MDVILDIEPEESSEEKKEVDANMIERYAILLYGLIHQRYLLTRNGLRVMAQRYSNEHFGVCPRVYCYQCPVIPCGRYDEVGAHFGTTFPHLLFEQYPDLLPNIKPRIYQPRIFGFRVSERSKAGPQMQWLRIRSEEQHDEPSH